MGGVGSKVFGFAPSFRPGPCTLSFESLQCALLNRGFSTGVWWVSQADDGELP